MEKNVDSIVETLRNLEVLFQDQPLCDVEPRLELFELDVLVRDIKNSPINTLVF